MSPDLPDDRNRAPASHPTPTRPQLARSTYIASQTFVQPQTNALAIVALISGIAGLVQIVPVLGPLIALTAGHIARRQIAVRREGGRQLADTGVVLGWLGIVVTCIVVGVLVWRPWM